MKKLLIAILVIVAAYAVGAAVFAVANGQAEGKMLVADKQLLADGDMEKTDTSSWSAGSGATLSKVAGRAVDGDRILRVSIPVADTNGYAGQTGIKEAGTTYRITGWARGDGVNGWPRIFDTNTTDVWLGTTSNEWQRIDVTFVSIGASLQLYVTGNVATADVAEYDDVVLTEYSGKTTIADTQLLTDGDMEKSGTTDWTVFQITPSKELGAANGGDQVLRLSYDGSHSSGLVYQTIFTTGKKYRITGWARGDGTGRPRIQDGLGGILWIGTTSASWQKVDVNGVAAHTRIYLYGELLSAGKYVEFDDILATEYDGKLTLSNTQLLTDGDMEASDTTAWTALRSGVLTKELGAAGDGLRVLRITYGGIINPGASQTVMTAGKRYRATGWARSNGSVLPYLANDSATNIWSGTTSVEWQYFDVVFVADGTDIKFRTFTSSDNYVEWDDVLVTEL